MPLSLLWIPIALALFACEQPTPNEEGPLGERWFDETFTSRLSDSRANTIRDSADAAFAALEDPASRSETRVGPQPWPEDLPTRWPVLAAATVVADIRRNAGDRLLLLNLPGSSDHAMAAYQSTLREHGYQVEQPQLRRDHHALHARNGEHQAILTFFARANITRVEILFLARTPG